MEMSQFSLFNNFITFLFKCLLNIFHIQEMALVAEDLKKKFLIKNTDFFLKNFKPVNQDIEAGRIK